MKKKFNIIYCRLLDLKLDKNILCSEFWRKIINLQVDFDENKCWTLLTDHFEWLINTGVASTTEIRDWFTEAELNSHNIYIKGLVSVKDKSVIGLGSVKFVATNHSKVILFDSASCEAYDSTFVKGFQNSKFTVKECVGEAFDKCKCVAGYQSKVEAWGDAKVKAEAYSFVVKHDNVTGEVSNKAYSIVQ